MISKIWLFIKCYLDYLKHRIHYRKFNKLRRATRKLSYTGFLGEESKSLGSLKWFDSFSEFKKKWHQRYTVTDMKRLRYLTKVAIESPSTNPEVEHWGEYEKDRESQ